MPITRLLAELCRHLQRQSWHAARQQLLERADRYQSTQPSYAEDLRATALRQAASNARAAPRNAGDWRAWITNNGMAAK
jgi:23S rRNA G2445 N2-methylase RlmL